MSAGLVIDSSGVFGDEGETTRVGDDDTRACCDLEGVSSGEDILDAIDDRPCCGCVEDVLFTDRGSV